MSQNTIAWQILPSFNQCKKLESPTGNSLSKALNFTDILASYITGDFQPLNAHLDCISQEGDQTLCQNMKQRTLKKQLWTSWKRSQKISGEKTENKSKHVWDTNKSTMPQRYHIFNMIPPYKSKNRSSISQRKLMHQVVCYTVLRQICFPFSGYWTKLFLHPNVKSNTLSQNFSYFRCGLQSALEEPQKQCLPLLLYFVMLCTLQLFRWFKKREGEQLWNALCNRRWLHVNPCY